MLMQFENLRGPDGKVRAGVWDHITTWGDKIKNGQESRFDAETLGQMVLNWKSRGDLLPLDFNHQSSYVAENGQPAPALAFYNAMLVAHGGECLCFETLDGGVQQPDTTNLSDGLWAYRCEVTELGNELLPNFKYLSPTFTSQGDDELGNAVGYVIYAVAATNTPFQSGTKISFNKIIKESVSMFEKRIMGMLGLEAGADDAAVKAACLQKLESAKETLFEGESDSMSKMADELNELAKHLEEAYEEKDGPHVAMKKLAARLSRMAGMGDGDGDEDDQAEEKKEKMEAEEDKKEMEGDEEEKEMQMERSLQSQAKALANRLGIRLPDGASSKQMFDAISAASVPAAQIPALVETQVKRAMRENEQNRLKEETKNRARVLVDAAIEGGYPEAQRSALLNFASDPKSYAAAEAMVKPFLNGIGENLSLLQRMTSSGAPTGADPRREGTTSGGKDRRVVRNELATWVINGENFSNLAKQWADATDGAEKMAIDAMLSDSERSHSGCRLIAANRLVKQRRPDLWAAAEEQEV